MPTMTMTRLATLVFAAKLTALPVVAQTKSDYAAYVAAYSQAE